MNEIVDVKSQLKISLPIAFENLINILMTLVDTLVYGIIQKYLSKNRFYEIFDQGIESYT